MVETLFALAGYNKNGKKGRTGPEIRQARCVNVDKWMLKQDRNRTHESCAVWFILFSFITCLFLFSVDKPGINCIGTLRCFCVFQVFMWFWFSSRWSVSWSTSSPSVVYVCCAGADHHIFVLLCGVCLFLVCFSGGICWAPNVT